MKRFMALTSALALGLGSTAWADSAKVDSIFVDLSPNADDANVETVWPTLEDDLKTLLDAKFAPHMSDDGYTVTVRIIEVSLDGSMILTESDEFNHLEGWVYVRPNDGTGNISPTKVIIDAQTGALYKTPDGAVQIPGAELFYAAMLDGFADKTLETILEMN
mgnify:CR=1 FL=1